MLAQVGAVVAGFTVRLRSEVTDRGPGSVESATVNATVAVPTELCAGVPVITPVEPPIESPLGRLLALYL
jgi:hypothetical protein